MIFKWTDDLGTGVAEIDAQHKELFTRINGLLDACKMKKGKEEIGRFLDFLESYVVEHFSAEEKKMADSNYPGLPDQRTEHQAFVKTLDEIRKEFMEYGAGINVVLMAARSAGDWLVNHIRKSDKAMAAFLRTKGAR